MASAAKTRRLDCGNAVDRISNLPGNLIDLIIKRLSLPDAARMSILSKTWRDIWVMCPYLVFDDDFFKQMRVTRTYRKDEGTQLSEVSRTISGILLAHSGPILKFRLNFPYDMPLHEYPDTIFWIKSISKSGVRKVKLLNYALSDYKVPSYLYFCSDLTHLRLTGCILEPPLKFKGFSNLINAVLEHVIITTDMSFGDQLRELHMEYCAGTEHLVRQFKYYNNLTVLSIKECGELELQWFECIQKVEYLCLFLNGKAEKMMNLDELLGKMPRIHTLHLDSFFLESLEPGAAVMKRHLTRENLKYLYLYHVGFCNLVQIQYVLCLLRISPNLQYLYMVLEPETEERNDMNLAESREHMVSSVVQYLQLQNLTLNQLETVEIHRVFGSAELQFIKLLLASSPSLRWMRLFNIPIDDPKEQLRISQELMRFPRASTAAQIIWL